MSSYEKMLQLIEFDDPERYKIEQLKADWLNGPCWDIEDTEGFETYYIELKAFRLGVEYKTRRHEKEMAENKAKELNCSLELATYILNLEEKILEFENFICQLGY
jgi:hypothetical protein